MNITASNQPVRKREIFGWSCFDFANSSFTTIIITVVYAVYFNQVVAENHPQATAWWGMALAVSQGLVIAFSPWLGAVIDVTGRKKNWLMGSALLCSLLTALLYFTTPGTVLLALGLVIVANAFYAFGENICASFLPEISTPQNCGRISAYGWSFGYLGGLSSLGLALWLIQAGQTRWAFVMTGVFFASACLVTWLLLKERSQPKPLPSGQALWSTAWASVWNTMREMKQHRVLSIFFLCFTCFMTGLSAIIAFASIFAVQVLGFTQKETILLFAGLQISSAVGAFVFGFLQDRIGSRATLIFSLLLWIVVCTWASMCTGKLEFAIVGNLAGLGIGSLQSASRAVVSMLAPAEKAGEFFGFWGLFGRLGAVVGPLVMGVMASQFGFRPALLLNAVFFALSLAILWKLRLEPAKQVGHSAQIK